MVRGDDLLPCLPLGLRSRGAGVNGLPGAAQSRALTEPQRDVPQCAHWGREVPLPGAASVTEEPLSHPPCGGRRMPAPLSGEPDP